MTNPLFAYRAFRRFVLGRSAYDLGLVGLAGASGRQTDAFAQRSKEKEGDRKFQR